MPLMRRPRGIGAVSFAWLCVRPSLAMVLGRRLRSGGRKQVVMQKAMKRKQLRGLAEAAHTRRSQTAALTIFALCICSVLSNAHGGGLAVVRQRDESGNNDRVRYHHLDGIVDPCSWGNPSLSSWTCSFGQYEGKYCEFSKDASGVLDRTGDCPTDWKVQLGLDNAGIKRLREGVFSNMGGE